MNRKKIIWIVVALIVLLAVIKMLSGGSSNGLQVTVGEVEKVTIVEEVTANGKLQPAEDVKISPEISGEIIELAVQEGQFVEKGKLLVRINPDIYQAALNRVNASLNNSIANLANANARLSQVEAQFVAAEKSYNRSKSLYAEKVISDAEYETALQQFLVAQAEVEASTQSVKASEYMVLSAEASKKEALDNLKRTEIYAPQSGTISALNVEQGERVVGTAQMAGTEMLRISSLNSMEVHVDVSENDIVRVSLGDFAKVEVDAYPNETFSGSVVEIANSASVIGMSADQVTNFAVKVSVDPLSYKHLIGENGKAPFRPGMSASVDIVTDQQKDVLGVPIQAVTVRTDTSSTFAKSYKAKKEETKEEEEPIECVFVLNGAKVKLVPIKSGIQDRNFIQILSGLEEGDEIVTGPYSALARTLRNGKKVEVVKKEDLFQQD